jgi:biotin carboxyl carrier protein
MNGRMLSGWLAAALAAGTLFAEPSQSPEPVTEASPRVIAANCRVKFAERRTLATERPGILSEAAREGVRVEAGQVVLRVRDAVPRSALAVAMARADSDADMRAASKELEAVRFELENHLQANQSRPGTYTEIEVRRIQLAAESAALKVEQADQERQINQRLREQAENELSTFDVPSTIAGLVTRAFKGSGEAVLLGEPILEVVNTEVVRVEGFVPLADAWRLRVGMPVTVRVELAGRTDRVPAGDADQTQRFTVTLRGELGFVDVDVQPIAKVVRVWAELANQDDLLREGMEAELTIGISGPPPAAADSSTSLR